MNIHKRTLDKRDLTIMNIIKRILKVCIVAVMRRTKMGTGEAKRIEFVQSVILYEKEI